MGRGRPRKSVTETKPNPDGERALETDEETDDVEADIISLDNESDDSLPYYEPPNDISRRLLGEAFDFSQVRIRVVRKIPANHPYGGFLGTLSPPVMEEDLFERYGGGKFLIQACVKNKIKNQQIVEIAGEPKIVKNSTAPMGEYQQNQPVISKGENDIDKIHNAYKSILDTANSNFVNLLKFNQTLFQNARTQDQEFYKQLQTVQETSHAQALEFMRANNTLQMKAAKKTPDLTQILELLLSKRNTEDGLDEGEDDIGALLNGASTYLSPILKEYSPLIEGLLNSESAKILFKRLINADASPEEPDNKKPNK